MSSSGIESDNRSCSLTTWLADVQAVLSTTPERWQRLVSTLPIDLLTRPPAAGEWSALQCLQHLLDAERLVFPVRFHAFLAGQEFVDFDPNEPHAGTESLTPSQLVAAFVFCKRKVDQFTNENCTIFRTEQNDITNEKCATLQVKSAPGL